MTFNYIYKSLISGEETLLFTGKISFNYADHVQLTKYIMYCHELYSVMNWWNTTSLIVTVAYLFSMDIRKCHNVNLY